MYCGTWVSIGEVRSSHASCCGDVQALLERRRIVRADLAADAVLERRDDLAARGVVLRVGGEHQHQVERQAHRVAFDLHVAFLHDVEQPDLDLAGQVRQLVDGEDAAVGARQQAVVHGQLVGDVLPAARGLDRIDVADHVGDGHVGRGQFLHVALLAAQPGDGRVVPGLLHQVAAAPANGLVRVVVDLAALDVRDCFVQQRRQHADQPRLGLPAQSQQDEVVARQNGVDHLRHHGLLVADDAGKQRLSALELADQVAPQLILH